ncbi:MAG: Fe-S cluster assembly protein SufD [Chitinophagales bacterium]|nr:Fe-S cluster assembly protein SufD [Chitinophagales bacterium]
MVQTLEQQFKQLQIAQPERVRYEALRALEHLIIPSSRHEEWKYTNIKSKLSKSFVLTPIDAEVNVAVKNYIASLPPYAYRLVFLNGIFHQELSIIPEMDGVFITHLKEAFASGIPTAEKYYAQAARFQDDYFTALNTAFACDGALIYLQKNVSVDEPIYLHYFFTAAGPEAFPQSRNLVVLERGATLRIAEDFRNASNITVQYNHVSEMYVGEGAQLNVVQLQTETRNVRGIHTLEAHVARDAEFNISTITFEADTIRNNINVRLHGQNAHADLSGLYFGKADAHIDNHVLVDHVASHCTSNQLYKGVLSDEATGVFNGKIFVKPQAQKTNAFQSSKALLLSKEAKVNSKPQLEIFADDVKCSHGAAIGQLDESTLFYLQTRGISRELGKQLLTYAFAHEVIDHISTKPLRQFLCDKLKEELKLNW